MTRFSPTPHPLSGSYHPISLPLHCTLPAATQKAARLQDYQSQLKAREQQNKQRLMEQRQEADNAAQSSNTATMNPEQLAAKIQEQPDAQAQLAMIERETQELLQESSRPWGEKRPDHQIQLLLLKLQIQKRKIMSSDSAESPARNVQLPTMPNELVYPPMPGTPGNANQYQMQLMLLEQQNKKRLMHAMREQEAMDAEAAAQAEAQGESM
jgi:hypothetical protein